MTTSHTPRNLIYYQGSDPGDLTLIAQNDDYTHVEISALHFVAPDTPKKKEGDLYLNDTLITDVPDSFWNAVAACVQSGKTVLALLGGAGDGSFRYITDNQGAAAKTLVAQVISHGIDGIDLDWETSDYSEAVLSDFTSVLKAALGAKLVTHSPVPGNVPYSSNWWPNGVGDIGWINVQWYGWQGEQLQQAYEALVRGSDASPAFAADQVVVGATTAPQSGVGNVPVCTLIKTLVDIPGLPNCGNWGGVAGWDFTHTLTGPEGETQSNWSTCIRAALNGETTCRGCPSPS